MELIRIKIKQKKSRKHASHFTERNDKKIAIDHKKNAYVHLIFIDIDNIAQATNTK